MVAAIHSVEHLQDNAESAADLLRLLANPHRLQVLCALRGGEASVGEMAGHIGLSQSALSQHLAKMRADRIVATRRNGQSIYYRIADPDVLVLVGALAQVMERRRGQGAVR